MWKKKKNNNNKGIYFLNILLLKSSLICLRYEGHKGTFSWNGLAVI